MGTISYQSLYGHKHVINQRQINGHNQLSLSPRTLSHNQSTHTNGCDQLSMSLHGHKHLINQGQTNGCNQLSMSLHGHKHIINQRQTNGYG